MQVVSILNGILSGVFVILPNFLHYSYTRDRSVAVGGITAGMFKR
jgi:hypothetical protein